MPPASITPSQQFYTIHHKLSGIIHLDRLTRQCAFKGVPLSAPEQVQSEPYDDHLISAATKSTKAKC